MKVNSLKGLWMLINSIGYNLSNNSFINNNSNSKSKEKFNISFSSKITPQIVNTTVKQADLVLEKVSKTLIKLPDYTKMMKPILFNIEGVNYGMVWDKTNPHMCKLILKDKMEAESDWQKHIDGQTIVTGVFDSEGLMISGEITKPERNGFYQNAYFYRNKGSNMRMSIEGMNFRPAQGSDRIWSSIPAYSYNEKAVDLDVANYMNENPLAEMFFRFTKRKKSSENIRKVK